MARPGEAVLALIRTRGPPRPESNRNDTAHKPLAKMARGFNPNPRGEGLAIALDTPFDRWYEIANISMMMRKQQR
jgi:hypothetical protein